MNLYCICVCPLTQIRQLEKKNLAQMDYVDLGPKTEDLILEAQINFPSRKKKAFGGKEKQSMTCTKTVRISGS